MIIYICLLLFSPFVSFGYDRPQEIDPKAWALIQAHLIPENSSLKRSLDRFFHKRPLESLESFKKAGFVEPHLRSPTNIVVGFHPNYRSYLFKVFLDDQPVEREWAYWLKRIEGARVIRKAIEENHYNRFVVPKKWLYMIPAYYVGKGPYPKRFILIVERLSLLSREENMQAFLKMKRQVVKQLARLIKEEGLLDSVYLDNIPFTTANKIAFVDTEHFHSPLPIPYQKLTPFFAPEVQAEWESHF